jgi:hypothetical protein
MHDRYVKAKRKERKEKKGEQEGINRAIRYYA